MSKQLRELQARKSGLIKEARALTDRAAAESRDMNDEETSAFDALKTRIESASAAIDREAALIAEEAQMAMTVDASAGNFITVTDVRVRPLDPFAAAEEGFMYGAAPVSTVSLRLETIWLREWTGPFMPDDLRARLNTSGTLLGAGTTGAEVPPEGVDPNAAPTDAPQG